MHERYESEINRGVPPARPGEFAPVQLGQLLATPPVVLAPMAGITNYPFRTLCRGFGAGLYVSEMITARALVERQSRRRSSIADFGPDESPRSMQLYGVEPKSLGERRASASLPRIKVDHHRPQLRLPRPQGHVARAAAPRSRSSRACSRVIVRAAASKRSAMFRVTIKFRMGIDDDATAHLPRRRRIGQEEGCAAVALHARTAAQLYDGQSRGGRRSPISSSA